MVLEASHEPALRGFTPFVQCRTHEQVNANLHTLHVRFPDFAQRLQAVVRLRAHTPYVLGCLGEETLPDPDPLFRVDQVDCTVLVLTSLALAHAHTWDEARGWMQRLNYRQAPDGSHPVCYANREHFTEERLAHSPWFTDITSMLLTPEDPGEPKGPNPNEGARPSLKGLETQGPPHLQTLQVVLNRRRKGGHLLDLAWEKPTQLHYLPSREVTPDVLRRLPPQICGVAFVRRAHLDDGVAIAHEGFVDSQHWLIHADSRAREVRRVDLLSYLAHNQDWFDGVIFYACQ